MSEPKPTYITINGEPLSTKQLRERIGKEHGTHYEGCWQDHPTCLLVRLLDEIDKLNMTSDAALTRQGELVDAMKRIREMLLKCKFYEAWIEINKVLD